VNIQQLVNAEVKEVEELAKGNQELKQEVKKAINLLEDSQVKHDELEAQQRDLEAEKKEKCISQKKLVEVLQKKMQESDKTCKEIEKKFVKEGALNLDDFMRDYMKERIAFHKVKTYKTKVAAN